MKREYKIPVVWEMKGYVRVITDDLDKAIIVAKDEDTGLPDDGTYVEDSFQIDWDTLSETEGY